MLGNNPVENVMLFSQQLLGVQKQTTNIRVLLELGQVPRSYSSKENFKELSLHFKQ